MLGSNDVFDSARNSKNLLKVDAVHMKPSLDYKAEEKPPAATSFLDNLKREVRSVLTKTKLFDGNEVSRKENGPVRSLNEIEKKEKTIVIDLTEECNVNTRKRRSSEMKTTETKLMKLDPTQNSGKSTIFGKVRTIECIKKEIQMRAAKRRLALSKFRLPFTWRKSHIISFKCSGSTIPAYALHRFQKYLKSKNKTHPIFYPVRGKTEDSSRLQNNLHNSLHPEDYMSRNDEIYDPYFFKIDDVSPETSTVRDCESNTLDDKDFLVVSEDIVSKSNQLTCPICNGYFHISLIEDHATQCAAKAFLD